MLIPSWLFGSPNTFCATPRFCVPDTALDPELDDSIVGIGSPEGAVVAFLKETRKN
jgi:hypothetical protein